MTVFEASVNVIRASVKYLCTSNLVTKDEASKITAAWEVIAETLSGQIGPKEFLDIEEALQKRPEEE